MNTDARPLNAATGWFKSTFSNPSQSCVEVFFDTGSVHVRDSKDRGSGPVITIAAQHWPGLIAEALGQTAPGNNQASSNQAARIQPTADGGARLLALDGGTALTFTGAEWDAFTAGAREGQFDLPVAQPVDAPAWR